MKYIFFILKTHALNLSFNMNFFIFVLYMLGILCLLSKYLGNQDKMNGIEANWSNLCKKVQFSDKSTAVHEHA